MSKKLVIEINLEGFESVQEDPDFEVLRALSKIRNILDDHDGTVESLDEMVFMDINGNKIGTCKITK